MLNLIKKLTAHPGTRKYISNTGWLLATQGVRFVASFFVGLWAARYLGPSDFGYFNYILTCTYLFLAFSGFGTHDEVVKELVNKGSSESLIMSTAFYLRLLAGVFAFVCLNILAVFTKESSSGQVLFLIASFSLILQPFEVVDLYNKAKVQVRRSSVPQMVQVGLTSLFKVYLIISEAPLIYFVIAFSLDYFFHSAFLCFVYFRNEGRLFFDKVSLDDIRKLICKVTPLMIFSFASLGVVKIDSLMIKMILGAEELGYYSSVVRITELLNMLPMLLIVSLFPAILNSRKSNVEEYYARFKRLNSFLFWINIPVIVFVVFFGGSVVQLLYSDSYLPAGAILQKLIFTLIFSTFSFINIRWYIAEGLNQLLMWKSLAALFINFIFNYLLLSSLGVTGAIISNILTNFICFFLVDAFFYRTRQIFKIQISIFNLRYK